MGWRGGGSDGIIRLFLGRFGGLGFAGFSGFRIFTFSEGGRRRFGASFFAWFIFDVDLWLRRPMGERIRGSLWSGNDFSTLAEGKVGATSLTIRRDGQRRFLLEMLTKRTTNLERSLALVLEEAECQCLSGKKSPDRFRKRVQQPCRIGCLDVASWRCPAERDCFALERPKGFQLPTCPQRSLRVRWKG